MSSIIQILILEDDDFEAAILKESLEEHNFSIQRASTIDEALNLFSLKTFDFAIIDIFINGKPEGITLASIISKDTTQPIPFLFLTGHTERSIFEKAKITNPYSFLLKPFNEQELSYTIELILNKHNSKKNDASNINTPFFFKKKNSFFKVVPNDIMYIEVEGRYCSIHTNTDFFLTQYSLKDLTKMLPPTTFIRVHRNYVVNRNKVTEVHPKDNLIVLENNKTITLGRAYKADFFNTYRIVK